MAANFLWRVGGAFVGFALGVMAYAIAFRNDGDGTLGLLLSFGLFLGGIPGLIAGGLIGGLLARIFTRPE
jgi:hypothetical protein